VFLHIFLEIRYVGKTANELKRAAMSSCPTSSGIPVKRTMKDANKWYPGGVARGSPPM